MAKAITEEQRLKSNAYQRDYHRNRYQTNPVVREHMLKKARDWRRAHPERAREITKKAFKKYREKDPDKYLRLVCESNASAIVGRHEIDLANDDQRFTPEYIEMLCLSLTRKPVRRNPPTPHNINIEAKTERIV